MSNLSLGTASGDTLQEISQWMANNASSITTEINFFLAKLLEDRLVNFNTVGDADILNYLQWDYNTELQQLFALTPGYLQFNSAIDLDIERIDNIEVPDVPSITTATPAFPSFDAQRPDVELPTLPSTDVGTAPEDVPVISDVAVPDAPVIVLPTVPTFAELNIPEAPFISLPALNSQAPAFNLSPPTTTFDYVTAEYVSELREPLVAKLLYDLEHGGYGIDPDDEQALWARFRERAAANARQGTEEAFRAQAQMSAPMPQGALYAMLERTRKAEQDALSEANRDIGLKRADMYVEHRKFTLSEVREYESLDRALFNAIQERALNAAKAAAEIGIALYDASVRNFNAQLEAYRTEAQVFEIRVRAELAKVEIFRSQLEGERLRSEINKDRVALYQSQLNGLQTIANLYKTRLEAANTFLQMQAQKVDIFKARVEAFAVKVRAKASEFDMYRSAVQGQMARVDLFKADIEAHDVRVRTEESRIKALVSSNDNLLKLYAAQVQQYESQLTGITKKVDARMERDRTFVGAQAANVATYRALTDAVIAGQKARQSTQQMNNEWNISAVNSRVDMLKMRLEQLRLTTVNRTQIDEFGTKFFGDAIVATMAAVSGLSVKST